MVNLVLDNIRSLLHISNTDKLKSINFPNFHPRNGEPE
jgi:hypothetical protein